MENCVSHVCRVEQRVLSPTEDPMMEEVLSQIAVQAMKGGKMKSDDPLVTSKLVAPCTEVEGADLRMDPSALHAADPVVVVFNTTEVHEAQMRDSGPMTDIQKDLFCTQFDNLTVLGGVLEESGEQRADSVTEFDQVGAINKSDEAPSCQIDLVGAINNSDETLRATLPLSVPVPKPLMPTPIMEPKQPASQPLRNKCKGKENVEKAGPTDSHRKSSRLANKPKSNLTMAEQATQLLMKKCGVLVDDKVADEKDNGKFRTKFVVPMEAAVVNGLRDTFGLDGEGNGPLSAVAIDAED